MTADHVAHALSTGSPNTRLEALPQTLVAFAPGVAPLLTIAGLT